MGELFQHPVEDANMGAGVGQEWEAVKKWWSSRIKAGHGIIGAGERVISFGRTSDSSSGVTKSIGNVRVFVKT
ncbi:MAG TPA: hypothetical protein VFT30_01370, partial [Nitrospira sp.]|nr:hypothetical protein [Nitrospira sp.]